MYIFAATGGLEDPMYRSFDSFDEMFNTSEYQNLRQFVDPDRGERVDILKVEDGTFTVIESFVE